MSGKVFAVGSPTRKEPSIMRWLDTHNHVCDINPDGTSRPGFHSYLFAVLDADPDDLHLVICPDGVRMSRIGREPAAMLAGAEMIRQLVQASQGRLHGACMVSPTFPREAREVMDRCFGDWGFLMLGEMMQYSMGFRMADPACLDLLRHAAQHHVPVMVHVATFDVSQGELTGMGQLTDLMRAAEAVPEGRYILGHFVGMPEDDPPHVIRYLDAIEARYGTWPRNFWAEIRDFSSPGLAHALARIPHDRLISGTDWCSRGDPPFVPFGTAFDAILNRVPNPYEAPPSSQFLATCLRRQGLDMEQVQQIAHGNADRLLGLAPETEAASPTPPASGDLPEDWEPAQSPCLYLTGIPVDATEQQVAAALATFGSVRAVRIGRESATGRSWGHAFVEMDSPAAAQRLRADIRQLTVFGSSHAALILAPPSCPDRPVTVGF
jgi:predicted TIM-barrel fold metal-dependent hydrolase